MLAIIHLLPIKSPSRNRLFQIAICAGTFKNTVDVFDVVVRLFRNFDNIICLVVDSSLQNKGSECTERFYKHAEIPNRLRK